MLFYFSHFRQRLQRVLVPLANLCRAHCDLVRDRDKRLVLDVPQCQYADIDFIQRKTRNQLTAALGGAYASFD